MKTNKAGLDLIKSFEGLSLKPYLCPAGVATIGYGSTRYADGTKVKITDKPITEAQAESLLCSTLVKFEAIVKGSVKIPLTENKFSAVVSHTYNTGGSKTLFYLVSNPKSSAKDIREWFEKKYTTANGKECAGLVRRRKAEANLYFMT